MKKALLISFILLLLLTFRLISRDKSDYSSITPLPIPSPTAKIVETYSFNDEIPQKNIKLDDFNRSDHRALTVYLFNSNIQLVKEEDKQLLAIKNQNNQKSYEYTFYSDLALLNEIKAGTASINHFIEKELIIKNKEKEIKIIYYQTKIGPKINKKYSFNYGGIDYLISVQMDADKEKEYSELTNKMLATMIPHTMNVDSVNKILENLK